jgi:hypothetical protein
MVRVLVAASLFVIASAGSVRPDTAGVFGFSDQDATLTGRVITDSGPPARPWYVVVFPVDETLRAPQSPRVAAALTDAEGRWIVRGLPAGDYLLAVVTNLVPGELSDPSFLEGERKTQDLRIGSGSWQAVY